MSNKPIVVNLYNTDTSTSLTPPKRDCYPWLRKLFMKAIDFLSDFDNRNETEEECIKRVVLFSRDLTELCFDHYWRVYNLTNREPRILFIGRDQWEKLSGSFYDQPVSFMFEPDFRTRAGGKVLGMRVIIVPWISGLFCLPDLDSL